MKNLLFALIFVLNITEFVQAKIDFIFRINPYATHQPILYEIARNTSGPIIEFGCGYGSTDLLHSICKESGRLLITLEDDLTWLDKFRTKYLGDGYAKDNSGWHKFYFVPGKQSGKQSENCEHWIKFLKESEWLQKLDFDVCLVDQSPWLARSETIKYLKEKSKYILLHDCDYFPEHGIFGKVIKKISKSVPGEYDFSEEFKHFKVFFPPQPWPGETGPPTLVGSCFDVKIPDINYSKF